MATTPIYSWPTPNDSDPFKNGASAIRGLGNAIDSTLGGLNPGLTLIKTVSFSGATTATVTGTFSSAYTNYRIVVNPTVATIRQIIFLQMGTTTANYYWGASGFRTNGTAYTGFSNATLPGFLTTVADLDNRNFATLDIGSPNLAGYTSCVGNFGGGDSTSTLAGSTGGFLLDSTQYTSFRLSAANNIAGTVSVYGYRS